MRHGMSDDTFSENTTLSFEEAIKRLEVLVSGFEKGKFSLEEAIEAYQEAEKLKKICQAKLDHYALQIQMCEASNATNDL